MTMFIKTLLIIVVGISLVANITDIDDSITVKEILAVQQRGSQVSAYYLSRCSRRFTPGVCAEPVRSVWTYDYQKQNCTERFGCVFASRTNRFRSHAHCLRRCRALQLIYTNILANEVLNGSADAIVRTRLFTKPEIQGRRDSGEFRSNLEYPGLKPESNEEEDYNDGGGEPPAPPHYGTHEPQDQELSEQMPPDIDDVQANSDFNLFSDDV